MQLVSLGSRDSLKADKAGVTSMAGEVDVLKGKSICAALPMPY